MSEELQSIAAIAIVAVTLAVVCVRYAEKRRKTRSGKACGGGCGCTKGAPPHLGPRS